MNPSAGNPTALTRPQQVLHAASAAGGILFFLIPVLQVWRLPFGQNVFPLRFWPGNLIIDAMEFTIATLLGAAWGGWWWRVAGGRRKGGSVAVVVILTVSGAVACGWLRPLWWMGVWLAMTGVGLLLKVWRQDSRDARWRVFLRCPQAWNLPFFFLLVALGTASDALQLPKAPSGWGAAATYLAERVLTQFTLVSLIWFVLTLHRRWSPALFSLPGWLAVSMAPTVLIVDSLLRLSWTKGIIQLCGDLEVGGHVDWPKVLSGGGVNLTPGVWCLIVGLLLAGPVLFWGLGLVARKFRWNASPLRFLRWGVGCWLILQIVHLAEATWMPPVWRSWSWRSTYLHLSPGAPNAGIMTMDVVLTNPTIRASLPPVPSAVHPDIYLLVVETLRADAIQPEVAPFLTAWKGNDCQPIQETRAASNATHLSWFSILHGRLPLFWEQARMKSGTAPLFSLLHQAGYRIESRAAGSFDYYDMDRMHFAGDAVAVHEHVPYDSPEAADPTPVRELRMLERVRQSVQTQPAGNVLRLIALDATHYPYKWHTAWTPPFADFEENPLFPLAPTSEELTRVKHRYWNSVAWIDHLTAELIAILKAQGRYDDSLIILTGDHGEEFKEHGSWFHCSALNQPQTRVPILVKWPAAFGKGTALTDASHLDLLPTLLKFVGYPDSAWQNLPGRPLQRNVSATSILNTNLVSQNGEAMIWRRDGWEAAFSWSSPWVLAAPGHLWLDRLDGPDGPVAPATSAEVEAELRLRFPDAFDRVFTRWKRAGGR